jgi:NAD+ synthase (glutamine-hydrolysing)
MTDYSNEVVLKNRVRMYKKYVISELEHKQKDILAKTTAYLKKFNIDNVVLGVSGGVDSSLVLAILCEIKRNSLPNLKINAINIHFSVYDGIFDFTYIDILKKKYSDEVNFIDVDASSTLEVMFKNDLKLEPTKELLAQSSYALRYQLLFTYAQLFKGITFGTTNLDELDYVGWFGKSSDMVVDIQIISNLHKFEVKTWAIMLGVPDEIVLRAPVGDLVDLSSDEENFGCTYDELAWYSKVGRYYGTEFLKQRFAKVEELHKKNLHKYQGQTFNPVFI